MNNFLSTLTLHVTFAFRPTNLQRCCSSWCMHWTSYEYIASTFSRAQNTKLSHDAPVCVESDCMFVLGTASLNFRIWLILTLGFLTTLQNPGFLGDDEVWTEPPSSWPSSWKIRRFIKCYLWRNLYPTGTFAGACHQWTVLKSMVEGEPTHTLAPWRQGFRHPTRNECMGWFAQI